MSKAFTKEDDGGPAPVIVPHRASLPTGVPNYVTARGLAALQAELVALDFEKEEATRAQQDDEPVRRRKLEGFARRRSALEARLTSAVLVGHPAGVGVAQEVRFGASVTVRAADGGERRYDIVGVDEADASAGRIAFVAPLARVLLGRLVGDVVTLPSPRGKGPGQGQEEARIVAVTYGG